MYDSFSLQISDHTHIVQYTWHHVHIYNTVLWSQKTSLIYVCVQCIVYIQKESPILITHSDGSVHSASHVVSGYYLYMTFFSISLLIILLILLRVSFRRWFLFIWFFTGRLAFYSIRMTCSFFSFPDFGHTRKPIVKHHLLFHERWHTHT